MIEGKNICTIQNKMDTNSFVKFNSIIIFNLTNKTVYSRLDIIAQKTFF